MDMDKMIVKAGGRLRFTVERIDPAAVSATFIAESEEKTFSDTVDYDSEGMAYFDFGSPDTDVVGTYEYQVNENFASGSPDKYPNDDSCDGGCDLPTLEICASLEEGS